MKFVARDTYLIAGVVLGLAACSSSGEAAPASLAAAGGSPTSTAAAGSAAAAAGSTSAGTSTGGLAAAGAAASAAGTSADAAAGGATFTAVFSLLTGGCATGGYCHGSTGGLSKLSLVDQAKAYTELVGAPAMGMTGPGAKTMGGCGTSMLVRVKAGDPDNSLLMQKLQGKPTCGDAMPPGGMLMPAELTLVHDWIAAGALNN